MMHTDKTAITDNMTQHLDLSMLKSLFLVLGNNFIDVIEYFLLYAPQQIVCLEQAFEKEDYKIIRSKAHQFKGESQQMGAQHLSYLCQIIENELKTLSFDKQLLNNILSELKIEQQYVCEQLQRHVDNKQFLDI